MASCSLRHISTRGFASLSSRLKVDPLKLVYGVTKEKIDSDPVVAEYMLANFPEAFEEEVSNRDAANDFINNLHPLEDQPKASELKREVAKQLRKDRKDIVYPRNIRPMKTFLRDPNREDGTRNSKRLRFHEKLIPGLLCGSDPRLGIYSHQPKSKTFLKTPWNLLHRELVKFRHNVESRVYELTIHKDENDQEGFEKHIVTPENVNYHPFLETIYCANFVRYHPGRPLRIPVQYINQEESPVLRRDGFIIPIQRHIECLVEDGVDIPEAVEIECTGLSMKNKVIRKERVVLPDGVRLSDRVEKRGEDYVIGVVQGGGREEPTEAKEEAKK